jgi:hypothetical protein
VQYVGRGGTSAVEGRGGTRAVRRKGNVAEGMETNYDAVRCSTMQSEFLTVWVQKWNVMTNAVL